jgi:hypothetical protein
MPLVTRLSPLAAGQALAFALIAVVATGCSGINASKSFSPLDFILPGLMQNCPPSPTVPLETITVPLLAQAGPVPLWIQQ